MTDGLIQRKHINSFKQLFKPNKANLSLTLILFALSVELTGGWQLIMSNLAEPSTQGFSAGFPFDIVNKTAGFCPSAPPSSEPVECVRPPVELRPVGLISNPVVIYSLSCLGLETFRRRSKWL